MAHRNPSDSCLLPVSCWLERTRLTVRVATAAAVHRQPPRVAASEGPMPRCGLAPVAYNEAELAPDPPASPLLVPVPETGFTPAWPAYGDWASAARVAGLSEVGEDGQHPPIVQRPCATRPTLLRM